MARINEHYRKLAAGYLFPEIGRRVRAFAEAHPEAKRHPARHRRRDAAARARDRRGDARRGRRDGQRRRASAATRPDQGYDFLLDAIREHDYRARGVDDRRRRDLRLRRQQAGQREHPGDLRPGLHDRGHRPGLPGLRRHERDGRPHGHGRRARAATRASCTCPATEANGFAPEPPRRARRRRLPVLAEQPDRHGARRARSSSAGWRGRARTTPC